MRLKFYTDAHIPKQVAVQLRNRGVDVVRCQEIGMDNEDDLTHLTYATQEGRALVSIDSDFQGHFREYIQSGQSHAGIFSISSNLQGTGAIGRMVKELFVYWELIETGAGTIENDIVNHIFYIK